MLTIIIVVIAVCGSAFLIDALIHALRMRIFYKTVQDTHGNMHIKPKYACQIYRLYSTGKYSQRQLATMYGISQRTIGRVIERLEWLDYAHR